MLIAMTLVLLVVIILLWPSLLLLFIIIIVIIIITTIIIIIIITTGQVQRITGIAAVSPCIFVHLLWKRLQQICHQTYQFVC